MLASPAMRAFGRSLQVLGLVLPITGLLLALQSRSGMDAMGYEFGLLALGAGVFWIGLTIQRRA